MTLQQKGLKDTRTCRIFFSSPFGGMEDEREELTRRYFPRIHHLCGSRGIQFVAVDMRWGITTESSSSAQVINICLRELDRSDMFVGFFGQRYGWHGADDKALQENFDNAVTTYPWLDRYRDKSVTELEFLHGHLNNPGDLPAVICFRDKAYDDEQREAGIRKGDKKQVFKYSAESELSVQLMDDLKKRVMEIEDKVKVQTLGVHMNYKTPAEGAELMFNAIWKHLTEVLLKDTKKETKMSRILSEHNAFLSSRTLLYVGNSAHFQTLTHSINAEQQQHYLVTGPAGSGKSALLCNWIKQLKSDSAYSNISLVYHFVGAAEESTNIRSMLVRLIDELEKEAGESTDDVERKYFQLALSDLVNQMVVCFEKLISQGKSPVLVLDGIDKVRKTTKVEKPMYWLATKLPSGVRVVVSTKSTDTDNIKELIDERKFTQIDVSPLTLADQKELSEKTLMQSGKELSPNQLQRIVEAEETKNPLYLKITLNELVVFGYFRLLDKKIDSLISSANVVELFDKVLQRLEDDYNVKEYTGNLVEQTMCAICLSNNGLSETDLMEVYQIPSHIWSPLYFTIKTYIVEQNNVFRLAFTELEDAVTKRYLKESAKRDKYLKDLIQYFEKEKENLPMVLGEDSNKENRVAHELPWLYLKYDDLEGLKRSLLHLTIMHVLYRDCMYDLIELWNKTGTTWNKITDLYMKQIDLILVDYNEYIEANLLENNTTPPLMLSKAGFLENLWNLMENVSAYSSFIFTERYVRITLPCIDMYPQLFFEGDKDKVMYTLACQYCEAGKLDEAERTHLEVIESRTKRYEKKKTDKNSMELGQSYHGLAAVQLNMRKYEKAEESFLKSKELEESCDYMSNMKDKYTILLNLGVICIYQERYEEALQYSKQAYEILEELYFGHLPESIGQVLTNIGLCYRKLMRLDEAEKIYKQSMDIKINAVGYNTVDVAKTLMNLGTLENVRENFDKALEYYKETVKIFEIVGVEESENDFMMAKENVLLALLNTERYDEALEIYRPWFRLAAKKKILYITLPFTHNRIIRHMIDNKWYDEALETVLMVLEGDERKNPGYIVNLHLIDMAKDGEKPERPREYSLENGLELFPNDPFIIEYILKDVYVPNNNIDKAVELLESRQSIFGASQLYDAANTWFNQSPTGGSFEMLIAINLSASKLCPDNVMFLKNVATSYLRLKKYSEALPHFLRIYELEPDDPQNVFWIAQSSCLCGEFEVCKKYCSIAKEKFSDNSILMPQIDKMLDAIQQVENENQEEENKDVETTDKETASQENKEPVKEDEGES